MAEQKTTTPIKGSITLTSMSDKEYNESGSKFVNAAGTYKSEMGLPAWWDEPRTIAFPLSIIDGNQDGKTGNFIVGTDAKSAWKIKEICKAAGVELKMKNGHPVFNPADFVGKIINSVWVLDERDVVKGKNIYKPNTALAITTESEVIQ